MAESQNNVDLIKDLRRDQRQSWDSGAKNTAEDYLRQYPELRADPESTLELLYNELVVRQALGEIPPLKEFQERFPELNSQLEILFEIHSALEESPVSEAGSVETLTEYQPPVLGSSASFPLVPGLEILRELGRGGMSVVYEARQKKLNRRVALKMLLAGNYAGAEQRFRFQTEAEALARLHHPHIVPVYEVGEHEGRLFLIMEYVHGGSLAHYLGGAAMPPRQGARLVEQLARAIHYAHQHGVVHRDLKPANVLLECVETEPAEQKDRPLTHAGATSCHLLPTSFSPKITDFGLAKFVEGQWASASPGERTQSGTILGTASYMAPEQAAGRNRDIGPAADIHALGAILYELMTGRPRFQGSSPFEILLEVQTVEPVSPDRLSPHLSRDLVTICLKCLQKEPQKRYATAEGLAEDLSRFLDGVPIRARRVGALERGWRWSRRNPRWAGAFATVVGLLIVIAAGATLWSLDRGVALARALHAEANADRKLYDSRVSEAHARSLSRRPGQRFRSLALLDQAIHQARDLMLPASHFHELRDAALAALVVPDLEPVLTSGQLPDGYCCFDDELTIYARCDALGTCSIRRLDTDEEVYPPLVGAGIAPVLSRDGRFLAIYGLKRSATVWRLEPGAPRKLLTAVNVWASCFQLGSGQIVFAHGDGSISLFELEHGSQIQRIAPGAPNREPVLALHPGEPLVAVGSYFSTVVQVRNLKTAAVEGTLAMPEGCSHLAWHPSGLWLAATDANGPKIHVFDRTTFQDLRQFGPIDGGGHLFFNNAGDRVAVDDWSRTVQLFDFASGEPLFKVPASNSIVPLQFSRDDRRLAGFVEKGRIGYWEVADGREYRSFATQSLAKKSSYRSPTVSADGRLLALATTEGVCIWNLRTGTQLACLNIEDVYFAQFESRAGLLIGDRTGTYRWPMARDSAASRLIRIGPPQPLTLPPGGYVTQCKVGRTVAVSSRTAGGLGAFAGAWVVQLDHASEPRNLDAGSDIGYVAMSPGGDQVATRDFVSGEVKLWDTRTGSLERSLCKGGRGSVQYSADGQWLAVVGAHSELYSTSSWIKKHEFTGSVCFAPDNQTLAVSTGTHAICLLDIATGQELARFEDPTLHLTSDFLFTPDGSGLISVDKQKGAHIWDLRLLRRQLAERGLDWEAPPFPQGSPGNETLQIQVDMGEYRQLRQRLLVENYDRTVKAGPQLAVRWYYRGLFHQRANRTEQAVHDLQKAVDLAPRFAEAVNSLAWLYATGPEKLRDPCRGVLLGQKAVKLEPENWEYCNTLGVAYYRAGRFLEAAKALEACVKGKSTETDAFDLYFLAMSHYKLGDVDKARVACTQARTWHDRNLGKLSQGQAKELQEFRTEAEQLLGTSTNLEAAKVR